MRAIGLGRAATPLEIGDVKPGRIEIRITESYSSTDRLDLAGGESDPAQTASYNLTWQPKTLHVFVVEDGVTVSHAGIVERTVTVGGDLVLVFGIGGVLTRPDCRGKGFGQMAVQRAEEHARRHENVNFGLLFCRDAVRPWYERLGWSPIAEPVWIDQPEETIQAPLAVMAKCFGRERWPAGTVRLGCLPW
jgi:aminoglycoside 2'-N-acetyltransferase I